jgi:hypothetical protein
METLYSIDPFAANEIPGDPAQYTQIQIIKNNILFINFLRQRHKKKEILFKCQNCST